MNHRQPEQLNNAQFPAESEPEYTLEEIMAEFGAPQEAEPIPEPVPEPEPIPEPVPEPEPIPEPEPVQRNRSRSASCVPPRSGPASAAAGAQCSRAEAEGKKAARADRRAAEAGAGAAHAAAGPAAVQRRARRAARPPDGQRTSDADAASARVLRAVFAAVFAVPERKAAAAAPCRAAGPADAAVGRRPVAGRARSRAPRASIRRGPCCVCWRFWTACSSSPPALRATPPRQPLCCSACSTP